MPIRNFSDYKEYVSEDMHHIFKKKPSIIEKVKNPTYRYQRLLRKCELLNNTNGFSLITKPLYFIYKMRLRSLALKLGFSISENTCGKGLSLPHYGTIIINPKCTIGDNCRIHAGVNIGSDARGSGVPHIGNNVYIGPGAKIFGDIIIGDYSVIGANAVVNESFSGRGSIAGIPAKKISEKDSSDIITRYKW